MPVSHVPALPAGLAVLPRMTRTGKVVVTFVIALMVAGLWLDSAAPRTESPREFRRRECPPDGFC